MRISYEHSYAQNFEVSAAPEIVFKNIFKLCVCGGGGGRFDICRLDNSGYEPYYVPHSLEKKFKNYCYCPNNTTGLSSEPKKCITDLKCFYGL